MEGVFINVYGVLPHACTLSLQKGFSEFVKEFGSLLN